MRRWIERLGEAVQRRATALEALLGVALIGVGLAQLSLAAAFVAVGLVLFLAAIWPQLRRR